MDALRRSPPLVAMLCFAVLAVPLPPLGTALSQTPVEAQAGLATSLDQARERIKEGDYDRAIEVLKATIERALGDPGSLRDAYLLLIKTYVFLGNDLKFKPQGREASNLNYQEAKNRIAECLRIEGLRHTRPEPAAEYPPEMIALFAEVRNQTLGSFRVVRLEPSQATVLLNGELLRPLPGDSLLGETDLLAGAYEVVVRAKGYKDIAERVVISPGSTLERPYRLARKRGVAWYATASTAALALLVGIVSAAGGPSTPPALEPLPPAPPPPTR